MYCLQKNFALNMPVHCLMLYGSTVVVIITLVMLLIVLYNFLNCDFLKINKEWIRDRLFDLNLPVVKYRRLRGDMIEVFKIIHNIYDATVSPHLPFNTRAYTRGNS